MPGINRLSAELNLDTGKFTTALKTAAGQVQTFKGQIAQANQSIADARKALDGGAAAAEAYAKALAKANASKADASARQDFIQGLMRELQTMGMSRDEMLKYEAAQLKMVGATKQLRSAIEQKRQALAANAAADRKSAALQERLILAEEQRAAAAGNLIKSMRDELLVLTEGEEALRANEAAALGVSEVYEGLVAKIEGVQAALREKATAAREATAADKEAAEAQASMMAEAEAQNRQATAMLAAQRERIMVLKEGTQAVMQAKAAELGIGETYARGAAQERELIAAHREAEATVRALAAADREGAGGNRALGESFGGVTRGAHGASRAIYEVNVLIHELTSGRVRQAIGSLSILMGRLGAVPSAAIGVTLGIGLLYGIAKPIEEAAKSFEDLNRQSRTLGVSISMLQTLGVASTELGVKTDKMEAGLGRLDQAFARARAGSKQAADGFNALGVSTKQNYTQQQLFQSILAGWGKLADGPRKVAVATELFGKSGRDLIPVLDQVAGHWDEINAKAIQYGVVNDKAVVQGTMLAAKFNDASVAFKGLANSAMALFGPALNGATGGFTNLVVQFSGFLRQKSTIDAFNASLKALGQVFGLVGSAIGTVVQYSPVLLAILAQMAISAASAALGFTGLSARSLAVAAALAEVDIAMAGFVAAAARMELGGALATAAMNGLRAATAGLVSMMGGPLGIALIAAGVAWSDYSNYVGAAKRATDGFRDDQQSVMGALQGAIGFAKQYGQTTGDLSKMLLSAAGAGDKAASSATGTGSAYSGATSEAYAYAEAQRQVAIASLQAAAAQARVDADKTLGDAQEKRGMAKVLRIGNRLLNVFPDPNVGKKEDAEADNLENLVGSKNRLAMDADHAATVLANMKLDPAKVAAAAGGTGTTAGDPGKTKTSHKKTPLEELQEHIAQMQADRDASLSEMTDQGLDPVAAARAKMTDELNDPLGKYKGVGADSAFGKKAVDMAAQAEQAKQASEVFKQVFADQKKATQGAADAWAELGTKSDAVIKKFDDGTAKVDASMKAFDKYTPTLDKTSKAYLALANAADITKKALASEAYAEIYKKLEEHLKQQQDVITDPRARAAAPVLKEIQALADSQKLIDNMVAKTGVTPESTKDQGEADANSQKTIAVIIAEQQQKLRDQQLEMAKSVMTQTQATTFEHQSNVQDIEAYYKPIIDAMGKLRDSFPQTSAQYQQYANQVQTIQKNMDQAMAQETEHYVIAQRTPIQQMVQQWQDATKNMQDNSKKWMDDFVDKIESGKFKFKDFGQEILHDWLDTTLKARAGQIMGQGFDALGGGLNSLTNGAFKMIGLGGLGQGSGAGTLGTSAANPMYVTTQGVFGMGNLEGFSDLSSSLNATSGLNLSSIFSAFGGGSGDSAALTAMLPFFHTGGIVGGPASYMGVNPAVFAGAHRYHTGGVAGLAPNEVPAILQQGEGVFTSAQMAALGQRAAPPAVSVNMNNESGMPMDAQDDGQHWDGEKWVLNIVMNHLSKAGPLRTAIKSQQ